MTQWTHHPGVRTGSDLSIGERAADIAVRVMGSWAFLITQAIFLAAWMTLNVVAWCAHWDVYPFILLNLALSTQAAFAAPLILLAQRRQDAHNAEVAAHDLQADLETNRLVRDIHDHLNLGNN